MAPTAINLPNKLRQFSEQWSPKIIAEMDGFHFKLAKLEGEFVWHYHETEDELFLVHKGRLLMKFRDRDEVVEEGHHAEVGQRLLQPP